ncbi:MAG: hypothetical protein PVF47_06165 [Anaerolineae bacterium]|jgi:hypothetical protein
MSPAEIQEQQQREVYQFMAEVFGMKEGLFRRIATAPAGLEFSAHLPRKNQPELWADAPWRIEPGIEALPLLFIIRDGDVQPPGKGPYRLHSLRVEQRLADGTWHPVCTLLPGDLPGIDDEGNVQRNFWSHNISIPLVDPAPAPEPTCKLRLEEVTPGGPPIHLKILFTGSFYPYDEVEAPEIHLEVTLAEEPWPGRRPSTPGGSRQWFYGDTHYHSDHTNDVKEFGGPLPASRDAARAIGLDWLAITDHSCDLDERDYGDGSQTRFELLEELVASELSDEHFRLLLGEEVTLRGGRGNHYVHMLAIGGLTERVPGGFLPDRGGTFVTKAFKAAVEKVLNVLAKDGGYSPDNPRRLFGPVQTFDQVMEALPGGVVTFAAHPYHVAQPPFFNGEWAQEDLDDLRLTGHEFWNGRSRRSALMTDDPFGKPGWTDPQKMAAKDRDRIDGLRQKAEAAWDLALARGVDEWPAGHDLPARRPVLVAGSDAHGSFNYSVGWGWDYKRQGLLDDNALGRARTVVYLPDHDAATVPEVDQIVAALGRGACVVTDGPLLAVRLAQAGRTAHLGEVLLADEPEDVEMAIAGLTNGEFGAIGEVEVITYFDGQAGGKPHKTAVPAGDEATIDIDGRQGFCRAQVETVGPGGERFCCFTNPIWLRLPAGHSTHLRIKVR